MNIKIDRTLQTADKAVLTLGILLGLCLCFGIAQDTKKHKDAQKIKTEQVQKIQSNGR
ncbi:MAG: hypothetical protein UIH99_04415 [Alphaproteobacteria bacterium]|nr:hypothetical protein [Alphaproteobacteria bacterium]